VTVADNGVVGVAGVVGVVGVADVRRRQMLQAAVAVIVERGFPETRITDVAERACASPALVIYYFKTKDNLLVEALRYAEDLFYDAWARRTEALGSAHQRLSEIVRMSCNPGADDGGSAESRVLWLDLWAQSVRHPEVARVREECDQRWRQTIAALVADGQRAGEFADVVPDDFALSFSALLDGLGIQVALGDSVVTGDRAFALCMRFAGQQLGFDPRFSTGGVDVDLPGGAL
jgi:AcrR family transcriptional regulator